MNGYLKSALRKLFSTNADEVWEALFVLGGAEGPLPTNRIVSRVLDLIQNMDSRIQERAIFVAAIHWHLPNTFDMLRVLLRKRNSDLLVMLCAIRGISSIASHQTDLMDEASALLASIALDRASDDRVRVTAYSSLLRLHRRIVDRCLGVGKETATNLESDRAWIESHLKPSHTVQIQ